MRAPQMHDISTALGPGTVVWPGDAPYQRRSTGKLADGGGQNVSAIALSAHAGTHLDAPAHCIAGGKTIEAYPPERFFLSAFVAEIPARTRIEATDLDPLPVGRGEALLLKTANSEQGLPGAASFRTHYTYLSKEAADWCVDRGLSMVGIDYLSVDATDDHSSPVHRALLSADVLILEGLDLSRIHKGRYRLLCMPLKLTGCEASPVRAVLIED